MEERLLEVTKTAFFQIFVHIFFVCTDNIVFFAEFRGGKALRNIRSLNVHARAGETM